MLKYLRYSNIKISIDLNPFAWGFRWIYDSDQAFKILYWRVLFLSLTIVIDNAREYVLMGLTSDIINKDDAVVTEQQTNY